MSDFASFVLTESDCFYDASDICSLIILEHDLTIAEDKYLLVCVQMSPPNNNLLCKDLSQWKFETYNDRYSEFMGDSNRYPPWTFAGDPLLEIRAREALKIRSEKEKWFLHTHGPQIIGGYGSRLIGEQGAQITGGHRSVIESSHCSRIISGFESRVFSGSYSRVTCGHNSRITCGYESVIVGEYDSEFTGGEGSVFSIQWTDKTGFRWITGCVGEKGIEPDVTYHVKNGHLVKKEQNTYYPGKPN